MSSVYLDIDEIDSNSPTPLSTYFSDNESDNDFEHDDVIEDDVFEDQTKVSPMRGRSVKEYDEQLATLKKENFNLKLRIYFLEERMGSTFRVEDKDNAIRKNIQYQVDIETLRKELADKQDLLCQAVKALELEDSEHKRIISAKDTQIFEYEEKLETLEKKIQTFNEVNEDLVTKNEKLEEDSTQTLQETLDLQIQKERVSEQMELLKKDMTELELQLSEEKERNTVLEHDNRELEWFQIRCSNLETELSEKTKRIEELVSELEEKGYVVSNCNLRIRTLEDAVTAANSDLRFKEKEVINRDKFIQEQAIEMDDLKKMLEETKTLCEKERRQIENLKAAVATRDKTIAELENKFEKNKTFTRNLEAKFDSIMHENKRQKDELQTIKQHRRGRHDFMGDVRSKQSNSPRSPRPLSAGRNSNTDSTELNSSDTTSNRDVQYDASMQENNYMKDFEHLKLKEDYKKACVLISNLLEQKKMNERSAIEMQGILAEKDKQLEDLKRRRRMSSPTQISVPLSQHQHQHHHHHQEAKNSVEESDGNKNIEEDSQWDMSTLEWAKQVEGLIEVLQEKEEELQNYKEKYENTLQQKDNRIVELEIEVTNLKMELSTAIKEMEELKSEKSVKKDKSESWIRVTEEKDKKIEQLESEVRKQTCNLQGIVNKELWDKNREIEKLQNRFTEKLKLKEQEISELEKEITAKDMQLKMLKDKISDLGIQINLPRSLLATSSLLNENSSGSSEEISTIKDQLKIANEECRYLHKTVEELRQQLRNTPERDGENKISQFKEEFVKLHTELEKSEKMRLDTVNLCSLLTTRLEELAHFLDSLLKHKSVLGMLGSKQRSAIKLAIDQSLDLSKSLSMSMMNEELSLTQLSSITGFLNTSNNSVNNTSLFDLLPEGEGDKSLTFNSYLSKQKGDGLYNNMVQEQSHIIAILRAQIETMKKEIEVRDMELGKQNLDHNISSDEMLSLKNDNDVVECIIDLQNQNKSCSNLKVDVTSPNKIYQNLIANKSCPAVMKTHSIDQNCSESEAWSEPDRCVSQARIGLDSEALKNSSSSNLNRSRSTKSDSTEEEFSCITNIKTPSKRGSSSGSNETRQITILQDNLCLLENKLKEKENEILSLKAAILELDNKSLELKLHMSEEVAKLRNEKMDIEKMLKETEEKFKNVDLNNDEMLIKLEEMEEERDVALSKLQYSTVEIDKLKLKTKELEIQLQVNQQEYNSKLAEINETWKSHLEKIEHEHSNIKTIELEELKNKYETEWIHKNELSKQRAEMEFIYNEMENVKGLLKSSECKIISMEKAEQEMKKKLVTSEDAYREKLMSLKRELNESTLRASQAALERTKVSNEKLKLEAEIRKIEMREAATSNELEIKIKEFTNLKNNLQKQVAQAEQQKSILQLKVSELETTNAELLNRLIKIQTSDNLWVPGTALVCSPPKISELVTNFKFCGKYSLNPRSNLMRQRSDMSGYASEDVLTDNESNAVFNRSAPESYHWLHQNMNHNPVEAADARVVTNTSPDLGIESDQGRFSSLETNATTTTTTRPLLQTLELTASMNNLLSANPLDNVGHYCNIIAHKQLEKDNNDLKRTVSKLEVGLEKTMTELSKINKNKIQVEKAVCKQIHKTSKVLRQARANLDSGSENEKRT